MHLSQALRPIDAITALNSLDLLSSGDEPVTCARATAITSPSEEFFLSRHEAP